MASIGRLRRRIRREDGAEVVEFALTLPLLLLIVLGIIEFGFVFREYEIVTNAAREGARIGVLPAYDDDDIRARINSYLDAGGLQGPYPPAIIEPVQNVNIGGACMALKPVNVFYHHQVVFLSGIAGYFGASWSSITLKGRSLMRMETAATGC